MNYFLMNNWRDWQVAFFAEHGPVEYIDEIFGALGADCEQAFVDQEIGYGRNTALPDMRFLGKYGTAR